MRLFIAIDLPKEIKEYLETIQKNIKGISMTTVPITQFHITLKFLGETVNVKEIQTLLRTVNHESFPLTLTNVSAFPDINLPRVLWVGTTSLGMLPTKIDETLKQHYAEEKSFHEHITLGRINHVGNKEQFKTTISTPLEQKTFMVTEFNLYSSMLTPQGAQHTLIETYRLH